MASAQRVANMCRNALGRGRASGSTQSTNDLRGTVEVKRGNA